MKVIYICIFSSIFLVLMAAWQYYARRLYNKKNKKRHHVLKKILSIYLAGFIGVAIYHQCSRVSEKKAKLELSTTSFDFGSIKKDSIYEGNIDCNANIEHIFKVHALKIKYEGVQFFYQASKEKNGFIYIIIKAVI